MFQIIFTGDNIDQGRVKINDRLFTGFTSSSPWSFLNSGTTGFSLEISGATSLITNNQDSSSSAGNLFVGLNNTISGGGGYNFVSGQGNFLTNTNNSFVKGNDNNISGLLDCFISGDGNNIYGGSFVSLNSISNIIFSSNTINNNYMSIVGSNNIIIENQAASSNPINNFFTILNNSQFLSTADTEYTTILPGSGITMSGYVTNSAIFGINNSIGFGSDSQNDNIFIFGSGIAPSFSSGTTMSLSGTYINNICIDSGLILNNNSIITNNFFPNPNIQFDKNNVCFLSSSASFGNFNSSSTANSIKDGNHTGIFLIVWENLAQTNMQIVGDSSYFIDDYGFGSRWDIVSNINSANTIFCCYIPSGVNSGDQNKYIRYKG